MILHDLLAQIETASHPMARALSTGDHFKVIAMAFKKGMVLKEHQTNLPARLFVLQGAVFYHEGPVQKKLLQFDETPIPINTMHAVVCVEDALCLLIQG